MCITFTISMQHVQDSKQHFWNVSNTYCGVEGIDSHYTHKCSNTDIYQY